MKVVTALMLPEEARQAARGLAARGFTREELFFTNDVSRVPEYLSGEPEEAAVGGAALGAIIGTVIGFLGSWLIFTLLDVESSFIIGIILAAVGFVVGGYLGSLYLVRAESQTRMDIHEELDEGKWLLMVKANRKNPETAVTLLQQNNGEHIETHDVPSAALSDALKTGKAAEILKD